MPYDRPAFERRTTRTPLHNVRGAERLRGDPALAATLAAALRVSDEDARLATEGLHAVHPFPGRLHPAWVRRLLAAAPDGAHVYDPFCGSGTVLVEARLRGLLADGSDLHPLAVRLAHLRSCPGPALDALAAEAERCAEGSRTRRQTPFSKLAAGEKAFLPHVLATLIALRDEIEKTEDDHIREVLLFSLTPLLDKLSSRPDREPVAMSVHALREHFLARVARWCAFFEELADKPQALVHDADARRIPLQDATVDVVITSPPYPGVYDYAGAQARWAKWLGITSTRHAEEGEVGRALRRETWIHDLRGVLLGLARVVRPGGSIYFFLADGVLEGRAVRVDEEIGHLTRRGLLELCASASQERPHFHRDTAYAFANKPRREHVFLLRRRANPLPGAAADPEV